MGMDLKPMRPTKAAKRDADGKPAWGRYNIWSWVKLKEFLHRSGVDVGLLSNMNDGELIPSAKCKEIADAIERDAEALESNGLGWLLDDASWWRNCGGCRIY